MSRFTLCIALAAVSLACPVSRHSMVQAQQPSDAAAKANDAIPASALLQPAELAQMLETHDRPLVLQVGSHVLYAEAHIPGSEYVGATGTSIGMQALRDRVSGLKKNQFIVLYCGCCPWGRCPNIRPAYGVLQTLGFTHVKALYIADNFGADWVRKGLPVAKGR